MTQTLSGPVHHTCFIEVGDRLVLAAARGRGIELIDGADGSVLHLIDPDRAADSMIALPGDDERHDLLLVGGDGEVRAYDPSTGEVRYHRVIGHGPVKDLDFYGERGSPEFTVVAILDSGVYLWNPQSGEVDRLPDPPGLEPQRMFKVCAYAVAGRPGVCCAYTDGRIANWDPLTGGAGEPAVQHAHDGPIWSLITTIDDDGRPIVVSGGSDRRVRVWLPRVGHELTALDTFIADGTVRRLGHVTDHRSTMLVTASASGEVALWRLDGPADRPELKVSRHAGEAWALACATTVDGVVIASGDMNGGITIKRLSTNLITADSSNIIHTSTGTIWVVAQGSTSDGPFVACAGVDRSVNIIDPTGHRAPMVLDRHTSTVRALAAGGVGADVHLVSGGADHQVVDWDPRTGRMRGVLPMGHGGEVWALSVFDFDGATHVISGSADGSVRHMAVAPQPSQVRVLGTDFGEVSCVVAVPTPDGEDMVVVVGSARGLRGVRLQSGTNVALGITGVAAACGVDQGGRHLVVVARQDGVVQLVDPVTAATVSTFSAAHDSAQVKSLQTVEVAGTTFVVGGRDDGSLLVWHIDGTPISNPVAAGDAAIRDMDVVAIPRPSVDGRAARSQAALLTAAQDGVVRLWPVTADSPLRSGGTVGRTVRPASLLLQDQPTSDDHLSRRPLVDALDAALRSPGTKPPVVIGIHAPWGQGKSSLLRQLRERVDPWTSHFDAYDRPGPQQQPTHELVPPTGRGRVRTKLTRAWAWRQIHRAGDHDAPLEYEMKARETGADDAITVWFNPWMYERTDQIWAGLTREILLSITQRLPVPQRERLWFDLNLRRTEPQAMRRRVLATYIPRSLPGLALAVLLLFLLAVAAVAMGVAAVNNPTVTTILGPSVVLVLTVLVTVAQLTSGTFRHVHGWVAPDELNNRGGPEHAWKGASDPLTASERGYLYMLQHDVGEVVNLATKHSTLYVFIDDLDRCRPEIVSDTVEAINLFLNKAFGKSIFVVALDPATVAAHLETAFKAIHDRAAEDETSFGHLRHTGWRFMEKIVDLPIRLPRLPDAALSEFFHRLLDADQLIPTPTEPTPEPGQSSRRAPRPRRADDASTPPAPTPAPSPVSSGARGKTRVDGAAATVGVVIVPDTPDTNESVALVDQLESLPQVRDALRTAVLSLPGRNPRQTKAFVNLWRFYMVLDHQMGLFNPSVLALEQHCIEMARLVELMVRWPFLLDPLGEQAADGAIDNAINLDRLLDACDRDDWPVVAGRARMDHEDIAIRGLRELLRKALPRRQVFTDIARRYL